MKTMNLVLFAFLGLIVATVAQNDTNSEGPQEWHTDPKKKNGHCLTENTKWALGPRPLKKKSDSKANDLVNFHSFWIYPFPQFFPPFWRRPVCQECYTDADCKGTLKCCGTTCKRCSIPFEYSGECGFVPTDEYCKELCTSKNTCRTSPYPCRRDYRTSCASYCQTGDQCRTGKCCRNMRCSFTCT